MKYRSGKTELAKVLGVNQKAGVKVGDEIEHPIYGFRTKVVAVYRDFLGNEKVLTEHTKRHVQRKSKKKSKPWQVWLRKIAIEELPNVL